MARKPYCLRASYFVDRGDLLPIDRPGSGVRNFANYPSRARVSFSSCFRRNASRISRLHPQDRSFCRVRDNGFFGGSGLFAFVGSCPAKSAVSDRVRSCCFGCGRRRTEPKLPRIPHGFGLGCRARCLRRSGDDRRDPDASKTPAICSVISSIRPVAKAVKTSNYRNFVRYLSLDIAQGDCKNEHFGQSQRSCVEPVH